MATSIYGPLDSSKSEIRLLKIQCSSGEVTSTMTTHSLDDEPFYVALSYVWGDPSITTPIIVNGESVWVTTNLKAALQRFPSLWGFPTLNYFPAWLSNICYIWADALCIDQSNLPERNSQVQLMERIYKNCWAVMCWLGPEQGRSTQVFQLLRRITRDLEPSKPGDVEALSAPLTDGFLSDVTLRPPFTVRSLLTLTLSLENDIQHLMNERQFWKRAWTFQEVILPPRAVFVCGDEFCRFDHITNLCKWFISTQ